MKALDVAKRLKVEENEIFTDNKGVLKQVNKMRKSEKTEDLSNLNRQSTQIIKILDELWADQLV